MLNEVAHHILLLLHLQVQRVAVLGHIVLELPILVITYLCQIVLLPVKLGVQVAVLDELILICLQIILVARYIDLTIFLFLVGIL